MKYKKKPIIIDAFQLDSRPLIGEEWFWDAVSTNEIITHNFGKYHLEDAWCEIKTLEGTVIAKTGDYIIRGVNGEIYPCKPEIFEKTYECMEEGGRMTTEEAIRILDNFSNDVKESSELGQALEIALVSMEKQVAVQDVLERLEEEKAEAENQWQKFDSAIDYGQMIAYRESIEIVKEGLMND